MDIEIAPRDDTDHLMVKEALRAETIQFADDGQQYMIMLLDADDTFDVVVQYPDGDREIVWSLVREREVIDWHSLEKDDE